MSISIKSVVMAVPASAVTAVYAQQAEIPAKSMSEGPGFSSATGDSYLCMVVLAWR